MDYKPVVLLLVLILAFGCTQAPPVSNPDSNNLGPDVNAPVDTNQPMDLNAPVIQTGSVEVSLLDSNQAPISGVVVVVKDANSLLVIDSLETAENGKVVFSAIPAINVVISVDENLSGFLPSSSTVSIDSNQKTVVVLTLASRSVIDAQKQVVRTVSADDSEFFPEHLDIREGSLVTLTIKTRAYNTRFDALEYSSPLFPTVSVKENEQETVSFMVNDDLKIESYWPDNGIHKATLRIVMIPRDWNGSIFNK